MERNESGSGDASLQTIWRYYTDFDERETHVILAVSAECVCKREI